MSTMRDCHSFLSGLHKKESNEKYAPWDNRGTRISDKGMKECDGESFPTML